MWHGDDQARARFGQGREPRGEELRVWNVLQHVAAQDGAGADRPQRGEAGVRMARGEGPVHALDQALRKALTKFYPQLESVVLHDYKVRVLGGTQGTAATVRVLIESGDATDRWGTVGVSHNVIEASWQALVDSMEYKLQKDAKPAGRRSAARAGG